MDISTLGSCVAIVMICYIVGMGCKASKKISDEWIPVIMAVVGGVLGAVGMGIIPDFPATDYITAVAVGMFNGLSATGVNQIIKQRLCRKSDSMGGRGGSSGMTALSKKEDSAQHSDAKRNGLRLGARFYEYTDSNGKVHKGETGNKTGGVYRTSYSKEIADYAKKSTSSLQKERNALKDKSNNAYQIFTRSAASKSGSQVSTFADADHKIRMIDQVLRRRKSKK